MSQVHMVPGNCVQNRCSHLRPVHNKMFYYADNTSVSFNQVIYNCSVQLTFVNFVSHNTSRLISIYTEIQKKVICICTEYFLLQTVYHNRIKRY